MEWGTRLQMMLVLAAGVGVPQVAVAQSAGVDPAAKKIAGAEGLLARGEYDLARREYDEFLQQFPHDPHKAQACYERGVAEFNLHDLAAAHVDLAVAIADHGFGKRDEALSLLGTIELQQGQTAPALMVLEQLVHDYPQSPQVESAQVNRAQALFRLGRFDDSLNAVRELLKAFPTSGYRASALYVGALDQRQLGDEKEAERTLREIVTAYPNSPFVDDTQLLIGETLAAQGRGDEAIAHYRRLETEAPESHKPAVEFGLGVALLGAGKYGDAERIFDGILQVYPASAYVASATLQKAVAQLRSGRVDDARAALAAAEGKYPQLAPSAGYWLARCDLVENKYAVAAQQLERLLGSSMPEAADAEFDLAYCELRLHHDAVALQRFDTFRTAHPHSSYVGEALYDEAAALYALGQFPKVIEFVDALAQRGGAAFQTQGAMLKGESLLMLKEYAQADAVFAALEHTAGNDEERLGLQFRRGQCAYFSGDYVGAEARLGDVVKNALRGDSTLIEATFLLGDSQLQEGKDAQAEATLKEYLAVAGGGTGDHVREATFKLATAQQRLHEDAAAAETLRGLMGSGGGEGDIKSAWSQRAWLQYAQLAYQRGDADGATQAVRKLLAAAPEAGIASPALYLLARIEMTGTPEQNDQAAGQLQQLLQSSPHDPLAEDATFVRGIALKNAHHAEAAERQFAAYLQMFPAGKYVVDARHQRAVALSAMGKPEQAAEAVRILADLAKTAARSDSVLYDLAWAFRADKDVPSAVVTYRALISEYPSGAESMPARIELAQLLFGDKKYSEAEDVLRPALADAHADARLYSLAVYWTASCAARLGDDGRAAAMFDVFVAGSPNDSLVPDALGEAGSAYANLGKFAEAERREREVMAEFVHTPASTLATLRLGEVQNQAGEYANAAATFNGWLGDHPKDPPALVARAHFGIGWSLENRSLLDQARDQYAQVVAMDSSDIAARAQFQIGETWFSQKQYETAAKELLKVDILYAAPQWAARGLYEAGRAFEQLHDFTRAKKQFETCIAKYKDSDVAPLARRRLEALAGGQ
jgi:TolA-binding protein